MEILNLWTDRIFCIRLICGIEISSLQNVIILLCSSLKFVGITAIAEFYKEIYPI